MRKNFEKIKKKFLILINFLGNIKNFFGTLLFFWEIYTLGKKS